MRSLPPALVAEIRHAFQSCSRQYAASRRAQFSTIRPQLKASKSAKTENLPIQVVHGRLQAQRKSNAQPSDPSTAHSPISRELIPHQEKEKSLDGGRKVPVPLKVIPKADIAPGLTLSPKERLHIEQLTRKLPPRPEPKVYKKRIRIYTAGNGMIFMFTFIRFVVIVAVAFVTVIVAPAHWTSGSPWWTVLGLWLAGAIPFVSLNWALRPMVTEIFLRLPPSSQGSPKLAMAYAKSLPADAMLDLRFMRATMITDVVSLKIANTRPVKSLLRPVSFEWIGPLVTRGNFLRPNPSQFYVRSQSAGGRAARDVTPGIWSQVYQRLTGVESGVVSKWRR